jgi:XTP/dITP diphosphohydrolase
LTPKENGKSFEENSRIKASYFSKKTALLCLSDDSGLEIDLLKGAPGIHSSRWSGYENDFNLAIEKVFKKMSELKKDWENYNVARFVCCLTLFWPDGKNYSSTGIIKGKISSTKRGSKGFGYDPIFIPEGEDKTFGEMEPKVKMSMDHRSLAFSKMRNFFY